MPPAPGLLYVRGRCKFSSMSGVWNGAVVTTAVPAPPQSRPPCSESRPFSVLVSLPWATLGMLCHSLAHGPPRAGLRLALSQRESSPCSHPQGWEQRASSTWHGFPISAPTSLHDQCLRGPRKKPFPCFPSCCRGAHVPTPSSAPILTASP